MLAWLHQTVASEREFLESLLDRERQIKRNGHVPKDSPLRLVEDEVSDADIVASLLDKNLEGTTRPLKVTKAIEASSIEEVYSKTACTYTWVFHLFGSPVSS